MPIQRVLLDLLASICVLHAIANAPFESKRWPAAAPRLPPCPQCSLLCGELHERPHSGGVTAAQRCVGRNGVMREAMCKECMLRNRTPVLWRASFINEKTEKSKTRGGARLRASERSHGFSEARTFHDARFICMTLHIRKAHRLREK